MWGGGMAGLKEQGYAETPSSPKFLGRPPPSTYTSSVREKHFCPANKEHDGKGVLLVLQMSTAHGDNSSSG